MKIIDQINSRYSWQAKMLADTSKIEEAFKGLELLEADFWADFGQTEYFAGKAVEGLYIKLEPKNVPGIAWTMEGGETSLSVVDTTPTLGDAARVLLYKVGKWTKEFDGDNNRIRLIGEYKGVRIILEDTPPETCTVEKIEEEVEVPEKVIPAHKEIKTRFVLKGDCDPLLTEREVQPEPVGNISQEVKNSLDSF